MRLALRCVPPIRLPRVPAQDGDHHEVEGVDHEKANAHVFSIIARVARHLVLALNFKSRCH